MAKLTNKQHEEQQDRRIKKLENDITQQKDTIKQLIKREKTGDVSNEKYKKKIKLPVIAVTLPSQFAKKIFPGDVLFI